MSFRNPIVAGGTLVHQEIRSPDYVAGATPSDPPVAGWRIGRDGTIRAADVVVSGGVAGGTIDIGGADSTSFHVDADGNLWLGAATYAAAPFKVSSAGALEAASAAITDGTLTGGSIDIGGMDSTSFHVDTAGRLWLGASAYSSAPFRVDSDGTTRIGDGASDYMQTDPSDGSLTFYRNGVQWMALVNDPTYTDPGMAFTTSQVGDPRIFIPLTGLATPGAGYGWTSRSLGGAPTRTHYGPTIWAGDTNSLTTGHEKVAEFLGGNAGAQWRMPVDNSIRWYDGANLDGTLYGRIYYTADDLVIRNDRATSNADMYFQIWNGSAVATRMRLYGNGNLDIGESGNTADIYRLYGQDWRMPDLGVAGGSPDDLTISSTARTVNYQTSSMALKSPSGDIDPDYAYRFILHPELAPFFYNVHPWLAEYREDPHTHPGLGAEPVMAAGFPEFVQLRPRRLTPDGPVLGWEPGSLKYKRLGILPMVALRHLDRHPIVADILDRLATAGI